MDVRPRTPEGRGGGASRRVHDLAGARAVVAVDLVWALDRLAVAAFSRGSPTSAGTVWIVLQALVVAAFTGAQRAGLAGR